jgi:hypothetical protein
MASDIDVKDGDAPGSAPATRIPHAVWINLPRSPPSSMGRAARAIAAAIGLAAVALAAKHTATEPLAAVPSAVAGTEIEGAAGNGATGYFPGQFDQRKLAPGEQPPTF